jgi:ABC-type polar amino acid transport system ATPase subunit
MVFQFHYLFEHLTVLDNVCLAPVHVHHVSREAAATRARALLDELGIGHRATALPRELSGGEAQRAAIARALAMDPPLLLLDEPTASLDPARRTSLGLTLRQLATSGRAMLVTSHDVDFVRDHASRVLILADGRVVEAGDPRTVLTQPTHEATRALLQTQ